MSKTGKVLRVLSH